MYLISILVARTYKKKIGGRSYTNYTNTRLEEALSNVVEGSLSILTASKKMNTPYGTIVLMEKNLKIRQFSVK